MKKESWIKTLLGFAGPFRGKLICSVVFAVVSVCGGFVPFLGVYQIVGLYMVGGLTPRRLLLWCAVCLGGYVVQVCFYAFSTMLSHVSAYNILEGLRRKIGERLMAAPLGTVLSRTVGEIKSTLVDRVEDVEPPLAHMIPELSSNILLPVAVMAALFVIDWRMGLACLATVPAALLPMKFATGTYNEKYAAYMRSNAEVNSNIVEYVEGIEVVKTFNQGKRSYEKFANSVTNFRDFTLDWFKATWLPMNLCLAILPTTLLFTLPVGVALWGAGILHPAQVALCLMLALGVVGPLVRATAFINAVKGMEFAVNDSKALLELPELPQAGAPAQVKNADIELRDVSFSYTGKAEDAVLKNVSLTMPQGSFTALVGPSGGGKSTLARLTARFWDVTAGCITIGGVDVREIPLKQLAGLVSFVTQDNFLFDCSLKENIRVGKPDASDDEVRAAAEAARCGEIFARLAQGWDTTAGDAGKQLSGGERQRIAIARAILKDAPIVILDEATAFTDPENEAELQQSILKLSRGKTLLVIAHRLSTIAGADQIVVLEKGRVVDKGTQGELLERCPLYQHMWQAHVGAKHWAVGQKEERHV